MRTPSKSLLIQNYVNNHVNALVKPMDIATAVSCTVQSVYLYIRKNPTRFTSASRGIFRLNAEQNQVFLNSESTI